MPERLRDLLGIVAAIALGIAGYLLMFGVNPLIPDNVAFLNVGDRAMHTLGWFFFRDAPWGTPPGASPNLGIELANSIALVDGLPLFAIPFKLLAQWLPKPFQYWGYWWLTCFVLQALFGYLLARAMGARRVIALLAAGFAIATTAFLFRLTLHMALAGHWVILAALWLYAKRPPPRWFAWPLLLAVTASIHAYLLAMVLAIWVAAYIERLWSRKFTLTNGVLEPALAFAATLAMLWTVGFFYTGSVGSYGFGFYRLNLLWPFIRYDDWSTVFPKLPHGEYDYEGISFLGIGIFAILALAIVTGAVVKLRVLASRRWLPLAVVAVILAIGALSNRLGLLDLEAHDIPISGWMKALGETFRSSGRFVWPLLYLVTVGAVVMLGARLRQWWGAAIIAVLLVAQVVDSRPGWTLVAWHQPRPADHWPNELGSPFWSRAAAAGYVRLRAIPVIYRNLDFKALEYSAYLNHQQVDGIYLGRVDDKALAALQAKEEHALETGEFEENTVYVVDVTAALRIKPWLNDDDLLATIDRRIVFARHGARLVEGLGIDPHDSAD